MRIEVEPNVLVQSGKQLGSIGSQLGQLSDALAAALGSGIASGFDPAGANFGMKYGRQAQEYADALAKATDAHNIVGYMLEATGYNYQNADAASTIGGSAPAGSVGPQPTPTTAGDAPMGPSGAVVPPPAKWSIIQTFLGPFAAWPSGNPSLLRVTAAQWRNLADGMSAFDGDMAALKGAVSAQDIPEGGKIIQALSDLAEGLTTLSDTAKTMAQSIEDFAGTVQDTQDAIRDLMDRLSLDGLWDAVTGLFTGEADDMLRDIADDIGQLLENFQSQVKGVVGLLEELTIALGAAADAFQNWIRPVLVATFGEEAGNAMADYVKLRTDFSVGLLTGAINTVSGIVSLADADTWKGMAELAASVAEDPSTLPGVLENMGKEFVAWDKWSGDHPGRAAGEAAFNIGSLFVPGGALSKSGSVAKGLSYTSRLLEEGRLPRFSDLPGLGGRNGGAPDLPGAMPGTPNVPGITPGTVPGSLVGPSAPNGINAPTTPASPGGSGSSGGGAGPGGGAGAGAGSGSDGGATGGGSGGAAPGGSTGAAPGGGSGDVAPGGSNGAAPSGGSNGAAPGAGAGAGGGSGAVPDSGASGNGTNSGDGPTDPSTKPASVDPGSSATVGGSEPSPSGGGSTAGGSSGSGGQGTPDSGSGSGSSGGGSAEPDTSPGGGGSASSEAESPPTTGDGAGSSDGSEHPSPSDSTGDSDQSGSGSGLDDPPQSPSNGDHEPPASDGNHSGPDDPSDNSRTYSLMDETSHETHFAPEQLGDNQRIVDALERHGVSRSDFIDLVNTPTDQLTPDQRDLVNAVRDDLPPPNRDTVMQKVIPPGYFDGDTFHPSRADDYIMETNPRTTPDRVGGSVTVADDTSHLTTPQQIHDGLRLDYSGTTFAPHDPGTHIIRFQADEVVPFAYDVPRNSDMGGTSNRYDTWADPFTGNGFTKAGDDVVPEYFAQDVTMREGAEMWEVLDDGSQRLVAVLKDEHWIPQGN